MLATVLSSAVHGIDALLVEVEVDIASGLPQMAVVGLPEGAVKESKDRVRSALKNSGYEFPARKITINLAPADIKKEGSAYDLPIALGMLAATGQLPASGCASTRSSASCRSTGGSKPVRGALPIAAAARRAAACAASCCRRTTRARRRWSNGVDIIPVSTLAEAFEFLRGERAIEPVARRSAQRVRQPRALRRRLQRGEGAGARQARARGRRRRRPQRDHGRPAGLGEDDAREAPGDDPAAADARRGDRDDARAQRHGPDGRPRRWWPRGRSARRTTPSATPA